MLLSVECSELFIDATVVVIDGNWAGFHRLYLFVDEIVCALQLN